MEYHRVLALSEVPKGRMKSCVLAGREIVICHTREGIVALDNICTHAHARMNEGRLKGTRLVCPLHGAIFSTTDGAVLKGPATLPLPHHTVRLAEGYIEVAIDPEAPPQLQG